ncbi:MAG: hypothetical protein JJ975_04930 [Bacteroidia bacterium]|nr:hypothetical protein [Bacteroidia bacterium]
MKRTQHATMAIHLPIKEQAPLVLLILLVILQSCSFTSTTNNAAVDSSNPQALDIVDWDKPLPKVDSCFIDTTRTSQFYEQLTNWQPGEFDNQAVDFYLNELGKKKPIRHFRIGDVPRNWVTLQQYGGELVLYDRCDGIDRRFVITDSSFGLYGALESEADAIDSVMINLPNEFKAELHTIPQKSPSGYSTVWLKPTTTNHVWQLSYAVEEEEWTELVTPIESIDNFDMIVNYCPESKVREFAHFETIDLNQYK